MSIVVNGVNLIERLKEYEIPFAKKEGSESIAGGFEGLSPEMLYRHLKNPDAYDMDENGKVSILACECGFEGCWPMRIKAIEVGDEVFWTDFEQPHRNPDSHNFWNYADFGPFNFDKSAYNEQLESLQSACRPLF